MWWGQQWNNQIGSESCTVGGRIFKTIKYSKPNIKYSKQSNWVRALHYWWKKRQEFRWNSEVKIWAKDCLNCIELLLKYGHLKLKYCTKKLTKAKISSKCLWFRYFFFHALFWVANMHYTVEKGFLVLPGCRWVAPQISLVYLFPLFIIFPKT